MGDVGVRTNLMSSKPTGAALIVEDDLAWQQAMQGLFQRISKPYNVTVVDKAEDALAMLHGGLEFDVIVADHYLAGAKTGAELWLDFHNRNSKGLFLLTSSQTDIAPGTLNPYQFIPKTGVLSELRRRLNGNPGLMDGRIVMETRTAEITAVTLLALTSIMIFGSFFTLLTQQGVVDNVRPPSSSQVGPVERGQKGPSIQRSRSIEDSRVPIKVRVHDIFYPRIQRQIERIMNRAEDMNSMSQLVRNQSRLRLFRPTDTLAD